MCGIVGYVGDKNIVEVLIGGLKKLEYRGYDSAGLAILDGQGLKTVKEKGYIKDLEKKINKDELKGTSGIGHTRWATHGIPSNENAHPHTDCKGQIALVHNGIIENFLNLKEELIKRGHEFRSETDTEVIVHLIEEEYSGNLYNAVCKAIEKIEGSYAIVAICKDEPGKIVAARKDSPLILGLGDGECFVASDIPAVLEYTRKIIILENGETAELTKDGYRINCKDGVIEKEIMEVSWDAEAAEKCGYEDFMLKEIYEQPIAIRETLRQTLPVKGTIKKREILDGLLSDEQARNIKEVFIIACGTSYYAGLITRSLIEKWAKIPTEVEISSEFRYRDAILSSSTLTIAITQSGETADTLAGIKCAKKCGSKVVAVTNVLGSSVTREADKIIYTHAGPEIGVAATKTLTAQITALELLALNLALQRESIDREEIDKFLSELKKIPEKIEETLESADKIKELANKFANYENFLFLGRGLGVPVAMEGALKLKEISYIHAEGYPA
ncbi:MAG: glutamine--fructose-6-phosphate transaminase (isomerizing), partial [Actinomycetia bacterium]|nr:glutamine--fructose-6-phosphate transaminase (isomerizing) [Actinomycetes bacterium]